MSVHILGTLYKVDVSNPDFPVMTELPGWHVNTTKPVEGWELYKVEPEQPQCIFDGVTTYFYKFDSEHQFAGFQERFEG